MKNKVTVGIDVSKSRLDYLSAPRGMDWAELQEMGTETIENDSVVIEVWLRQFDRTSTLFVLEPTGSYSDKLLTKLGEGGYQVSLVNPQKSHYFSRMKGITQKHDAQAARALVRIGDTEDLPLYEPPGQEMKQRKQLLTAINGLVKDSDALANRIHAFSQYHAPMPEIIQALERAQAAIEAEITQLNAQFQSISEEVFEQQKKRAMTISGIGPVIATWLLVITEGLAHFHSPRQLIKYCGLAPQSHRSGSSVNIQKGITKQACAKIRAVLYMGAKSAIRYNLACKELYQRLRAKGKPYYKAMVAVMAKLLKQFFAVMKSGKDFDNEHYLKFQKN